MTMFMEIKDARQFWERYKKLIKKDLPIILNTGIKQSTLSSWRMKNIFPRADDAYLIATAVNTTVEYLVTGQDKNNTACSVVALEIAMTVDKLTEEGANILKRIAKCLEYEYRKKN
jgi:transcriptional regulator with XRE-family HTH domain